MADVDVNSLSALLASAKVDLDEALDGVFSGARLHYPGGPTDGHTR